MVRRVNGLLLQLVVFELPAQVAEAAYSRTKAQLLHSTEGLLLQSNAAAAATAADRSYHAVVLQEYSRGPY